MSLPTTGGGAKAARRGHLPGTRRKRRPAAGNRASLQSQRRVAAREEGRLVRVADHRTRRPVAKRRCAPRTAATALQTHPRRRIPGHQYRAAGAAAPAFSGTAKYCGCRRQRSSHLPISRRVLRKLQTFSGAVCRLEDRAGFHAISRGADGKLPLDAEYSARGHPGDRAKRSERRLSEENAVANAGGGRTDSHRRAVLPEDEKLAG